MPFIRDEYDDEEPGEAAAIGGDSRESLYEGARVFHRRRDLFGNLEKIERRLDEDRALVKYEWPWDPAAPPEDVALKELVLASEVERAG